MDKKIIKNHSKDILILIVVIIAIIPLFYGFKSQYIIIISFDFIQIIFLILGTILIFLFGRLIVSMLFDDESLTQMKNHILINAFFKEDEKWVKWFIFPLTMLMEELIFRFYAISIMIATFILNPFLTVLISSCIFATYHIHFWFRFKNYRIFISFFILSFFLGLLNGYVFIHFGLIACFLIHYGMAFELYFYLYRKLSTKNQKE